MEQFVRIGNKVFNTKYIKSVECNSNYWQLIIANTESVATANGMKICKDSTYTYDSLPDCYNLLDRLSKHGDSQTPPKTI